MGKPTYFKFFDGYIDTLRNCETHKDRSILLMAMFDFWESGVEPTIPKKLQDKWRFLYNSLKQSRIKSYQKLGEDLEETNMESGGNQPVTAAKTKETVVENQRDSQILCPQTAQSSSTNRIKNTNKEQRIEGIGIGIVEEDKTNTNTINFNAVLDEDWKEATKVMLSSDDTSGERELILSNTPNTYTHTNTCSSFNTSSPIDTSTLRTKEGTEQNIPQQFSRYSKEEVSNAEAKILERIQDKYRRIGRPVSYTRAMAADELNICSELFYLAIDNLVASGELLRGKYTTQDGTTINSFIPKTLSTLSCDMYVLPSWVKTGREEDAQALKYFQTHPFQYDKAWDIKETISHNWNLFERSFVDLSKKTDDEQAYVIAAFIGAFDYLKQRGETPIRY